MRDKIKSIFFALSIATILLTLILGSAQAITVPSNIIYYLPITLTNYQGNNVIANTPIPIGVSTTTGNIIGFNALKYSQYYTCNLNNAEFFFANGTVATSWLEGNMLNEQSANGVCTSASTTNALINSANILYWVDAPSNSFLTANTGTPTTNTIYLGWAGNVISGVNTLLSNTLTGEAPQLVCSNPYNTISCGSGTSSYGYYDNGANVFSFYDNFTGTTLNSKWIISSYPYPPGIFAAPIINNGALWTTAATYTYIFSATNQIYPVIFDAEVYNVVNGNSRLVMTESLSNDLNFGGDGLSYNGYSGYYLDGYAGPTGGTILYNSAESLAGVHSGNYINSQPTSLLWSATGAETFSIDYFPTITATDSATSIGNYYVGIGNPETAGSVWNLQWVRSRIPPPNNIEPNTVFGAVQPTFIPHVLFDTRINNYVNITLNNQQQVAIASGTPIAIPFNALNYSKYLNLHMTNYEVINAISGTILNSWLETGGTNTISNGTLWVKLPAPIGPTTIATNVFSLGFASIAGGNYLMNGLYTGENPVLPVVYGANDNGANVFSNYCNFAGTTLNCAGVGTTTVTSSSAGSNVIDNGITLAVIGSSAAASNSYSALYTNYPVTGNAVDVWVSNAPITAATLPLKVSIGIITSSSSSSVWVPGDQVGNSVGYTDAQTNTLVIKGIGGVLTAANIIGNAIGKNVILPAAGSPGINGNIISVFGANVYGSSNTLKGNNMILGFNAPYTLVANSPFGVNILGGKYFAMVVNQSTAKVAGTTGIFSANWIRVRITPPNDIMPEAFYSATCSINGCTLATSCTFVTSNSAINFGSILVNTNTIGTTGNTVNNYNGAGAYAGMNIITVTNIGSSTSNILLSGSNWNYNANTFTVTNTIWSSTNGNTVWNPLVSNSHTGTANVEVTLTSSQVDTLQLTSNGVTTNTIWFGASLPSTISSGTYAQTINVISLC